MRPTCFLAASILVISTVTFADSPSELKRDAALAGIDACLQGGKGCRDLDKNIETLAQLYRPGDKAVLLTLLRFPYLTDFFDEVLLADPDGFLSSVASLPEWHQQTVAEGLSGMAFGLALPRFEAVRATLKRLSESSPNRELAKKFLETLETYNDSFSWHFPDSMFGGSWNSRELPSLGEEPLWPMAPGTASAFRIIVLPCLFGGPEIASLTISPDGTGRIRFRAMNFQLKQTTNKSYTLDAQKVAKFLAALERTEFCKMPKEYYRHGFDGAEWILEGVQNGTYHVVERWCPDNTPFRQVARDLFKLAHHWPPGGC